MRSVRNRIGLTQGISFGDQSAEPAETGVTTTTPSNSVGLEWLDGGIAGSILGGVISIFSKYSHPIFRPGKADERLSPTDRFPAPLFARTVLLGTTFGALEGCLRIAQDKIGRLKEEDERRRLEEEVKEGVVVVEEGSGSQSAGL